MIVNKKPSEVQGGSNLQMDGSFDFRDAVRSSNPVSQSNTKQFINAIGNKVKVALSILAQKWKDLRIKFKCKKDDRPTSKTGKVINSHISA
jgi:hypothetical protein